MGYKNSLVQRWDTTENIYILNYRQKQLFLTHSIPTPENTVFSGIFCARFERVFDAHANL